MLSPILEEIAYTNGWIDKEQLIESAKAYGKAPYGQYLQKVADGKSTKIIIPSELQGIAGLAASIKELIKDE